MGESLGSTNSREGGGLLGLLGLGFRVWGSWVLGFHLMHKRSEPLGFLDTWPSILNLRHFGLGRVECLHAEPMRYGSAWFLMPGSGPGSSSRPEPNKKQTPRSDTELELHNPASILCHCIPCP